MSDERFPVRIKVYGSGLGLLPPGSEWRVERTTEAIAPRDLIGEPMTEWTLIDLVPISVNEGGAVARTEAEPHE